MNKCRMQNAECRVASLVILLVISLHQTATAQDADVVKFVPQEKLMAGAGTLEFRGEATILGSEIKLKQICRWSDADANAFTPVADLIVDRLEKNRAYKKIALNDLRKTLGDAGLNLAVIHFSGAMGCTVNRADIAGGDRAALQQWVEEKGGTVGTPAISQASEEAQPAAAKLSASVIHSPPAESTPIVVRTLRDRLVADVSQRLNVPMEQLQVTFSPKDANLLNLTEPTFKFEINPRRVRDLGKVLWDIAIIADGGQQKVTVSAEARAWQEQVMTSHSVAYKEIIRDDDVTARKVLIDHLNDVPTLKKEQVVGQQASRELGASTVITSRMVESVPLAKPGQYITITLSQGTVQLTTVAKALEAGSFGQSIRVRNEETKEIFDVTLTAPQTATLGATALVSLP